MPLASLRYRSARFDDGSLNQNVKIATLKNECGVWVRKIQTGKRLTMNQLSVKTNIQAAIHTLPNFKMNQFGFRVFKSPLIY